MPYTVTKYPAGTFCWADLTSTDVTASTRFLTALMGWQAEAMPTGREGMDYTMFSVDGHMVAAASPLPAEYADKGVPSSWNNYVSVDDVDAAVKKAVELGATVAMPVMDVLDVGRMAGIQDPQGAYLFLWQPLKHLGAELVNTVGAMCWNELYVKDLQQAQDFYGKLFGWTFTPMEGMDDYLVIQNNGRSNGGMMALTPEMGQMPPMWMVYFTVADLEKTIELAKTLGGQVHMTKDIGIGTMAMIAEPTGAPFFVLQMSMKPEEWVE